MGFIYKIVQRDIERPVYVGQTVKPWEERWKEHIKFANGNIHNEVIYRAIRKHGGIDNFFCEPIEEVDNSQLNDREKFWIAQLQTRTFQQGYNVSPGGEYRPVEHKHRIFQYDLAGNYIQGFDSIEDAVRAVHGEHNGICRVISGELRTAYGFRWSDQDVKSLPPLPNNHTGAKKKVYQYSLDGEYLNEFESLKAAGDSIGKRYANISEAAKGHRKTAYGFKWSFERL